MTYLIIILSAFAISWGLNFIIARIAHAYNIFDLPDKKLKTHDRPTPRLGGVAIFLAISIVLVITRFVTDYPTGTIRNFRYILSGASLIFIMGLIDDLTPNGLNYKRKFLIQFLAAMLLLWAPIRIQFLSPPYVAAALSLLWIVGITNSINLIDIADGLAGTQSALAAAAFFAIGFPSEEIYVNILAAAVVGATAGFLPYNFSSKYKLFMGDAGSLSLGYLLALLALGCSYSTQNDFAVYAPLLILGMPILETVFLIYIRSKKGLNPFFGSRDHLVHRLQELGLPEKRILAILSLFTLILCLLAFVITRLENDYITVAIYGLLIVAALTVNQTLPVKKIPLE